MRLLCGDTHPDHDTICSFRRQNRELLSRSFAQVLELAARCRVLKVGDLTVAIDGTKVLANARRHERKARLQQARARKAPDQPGPPAPPTPAATDQYNYTDPQSRIMPVGGKTRFEQSDNAQAAVEVESRLIVGQRVCQATNDKEQLVPTLASVAAAAGSVKEVLTDSGFCSEAAVDQIEHNDEGQPTGIIVLAGHATRKRTPSITAQQKTRRSLRPSGPPAKWRSHFILAARRTKSDTLLALVGFPQKLGKPLGAFAGLGAARPQSLNLDQCRLGHLRQNVPFFHRRACRLRFPCDRLDADHSVEALRQKVQEVRSDQFAAFFGGFAGCPGQRSQVIRPDRAILPMQVVVDAAHGDPRRGGQFHLADVVSLQQERKGGGEKLGALGF